MGDVETARLRRRAASGDIDAEAKLLAERARLGSTMIVDNPRWGPDHHSRDELIARNGRWGTCSGCPREGGKVYPERCKYTDRYDHQLQDESNIIFPWRGECSRLRLAAHCGYEAARRVEPVPNHPGWATINSSEFDLWLSNFTLYPWEARSRAAVAGAERLLPLWESENGYAEDSWHDRPRTAVETARHVIEHGNETVPMAMLEGLLEGVPNWVHSLMWMMVRTGWGEQERFCNTMSAIAKELGEIQLRRAVREELVPWALQEGC